MLAWFSQFLMPPALPSFLLRHLPVGAVSGIFAVLLFGTGLVGCSTTNSRLPLPKPAAQTGSTSAPSPLPSAAVRQPGLQETAFWETLNQANVIYISEVHNNDAHHEYQFDVMRGLKSRGVAFASGWEMFDVSQQDLLDQWQRGQLASDALLDRVEWQKNWGNYSQLYEKMLRWSRDERVRVLALNAPRALTSKLARGNALDAEDRVWVPTGFRPIAGGFEHFSEQMSQNPHAGTAGGVNLQNYYRAQSLWDQTMAGRIVDFVKEHPSEKLVVLVGRGHVEGGYGVPAYVRQKLSVKQLVLYPGESGGDGGASSRLARHRGPSGQRANLQTRARLQRLGDRQHIGFLKTR